MSPTDDFAQGPQAFWREMAPCEHVVQVYADDEVFLGALEGFIGSALASEESVIVIATPAHLAAVEARLRDGGYDLERAREENRYIPRPAEEMLDRFMVEDWPDEALFRATVGELIGAARGDANRTVRTFGEMVAILWSRGQVAATLRLEALWSGLVQSERFPLFCAYPRSGFTRHTAESLAEIRSLHTRGVML